MYRVLASKHYGYAYPVTSENEVKEHLNALRKEHPQATHVCYGYRLGWNKEVYRFSDDGEPSGTAGRPIFGQIQSFDLTNVLIAVVRYFGGTKLGTGGLIDAYKTAARLAIENAVITERLVLEHCRLNFSYNRLPEIMRWMKESGAEKKEMNVGDQCTLEIFISPEGVLRMEKQIEGRDDVVLTKLGKF